MTRPTEQLATIGTKLLPHLSSRWFFGVAILGLIGGAANFYRLARTNGPTQPPPIG